MRGGHERPDNRGMAPMPRRLSFAVGTSLLGASLSLGCTAKPAADEKKDTTEKKAPEPEVETVNTGPLEPPPPPEPPPPQPIHVNEGPIEPVHVNEGPQPEPEPPEQPLKVNPGPETDRAPEPKHVNTRPTDI